MAAANLYENDQILKETRWINIIYKNEVAVSIRKQIKYSTDYV